MAKNHVLTYYAALSNAGNTIEQLGDNACYEEDNGFPVSVKEARPQGLALVDQAIKQLQDLRNDIEQLPMTQFEAKHGIGEGGEYDG